MTDVAGFVLGPIAPPQKVLDKAATLLIDTLGVAAGATAMAPAKIAREHVLRFHTAVRPEDRATLFFDGRQASLPGAAFAAATQIDNLDAHDGLNKTKGHIGCAVVPALCALAETQPELTGREALTALVMSYEVAACAATALHATVSDYHTSGAWNALAVAALACRMRGASAETLRHALGIAEYHGPRSQMMREIANPTMLHDGSGMGAFIGLEAAILAEAGFEGAPAITVEAPDVAALWADLGTVWTVPENYIKPYPICRWAHAAIDALDGLIRAHDLAAEDVAQIEIATFAEAAALYPGMPKTTSQAQYSLAFALAARLVRGQIGPAEITGAALSDPAIAATLPKISIREDARHSARFPAARWSDVTLELMDGRKLASGDVHATGGPEAPRSLAEIEAKFHLMAAPLAADRRAAIWEMRAQLQEPGFRFAELLDLLHPAPEEV